jgi:hypothetical protein
MSGDVIASLPIGIGVGVAATATMDVLGSFARRVGLAAGVEGRWVGRWYLGIARGQFLHSDIADAPERPGEVRAALIGHYLIGIVLAVVYLLVADLAGISPGAFLPAVGYALATCVFPWFLVLPALGFGVFGVKGPKELKLFTSSVVNHSFYGVGLWWSAQLLLLH